MKLYRVTIITPSINIERGVWANYMRISDGQVAFLDENRDAIALYPVECTMVTSIETKEEYDKRKSGI
jgi:hypothetical protein